MWEVHNGSGRVKSRSSAFRGSLAGEWSPLGPLGAAQVRFFPLRVLLSHQVLWLPKLTTCGDTHNPNMQRLKQENRELEASLDYMEKPHLTGARKMDGSVVESSACAC